jgi:hypothetical protein
MAFSERITAIGLVVGLVGFVNYWGVVIWRAATDGLPFTDVAWQGPMLAVLLIGGGLYGVIYGVSWARHRREKIIDERDNEIQRYAETAGGGLTGLGVLAALIMLALGVDTFWVANILFSVAFLGSLASAGVTLAAYRDGVER